MNSEAYGKSYERGFRLTVRFLMSRGVCGDSAEEAAQVAWTKGWERLGQLREDRMVVTWVNSIAWNVIRSLARKRPLEELPEVAVPPTVNLAAIDVDRALKCCKTAESLLLRQHYFEGHRVKDIARQEGRTATAVRIRLLRARRSARAQLVGAAA